MVTREYRNISESGLVILCPSQKAVKPSSAVDNINRTFCFFLITSGVVDVMIFDVEQVG
jgi:hypothetical protein